MAYRSGVHVEINCMAVAVWRRHGNASKLMRNRGIGIVIRPTPRIALETALSRRINRRSRRLLAGYNWRPTRSRPLCWPQRHWQAIKSCNLMAASFFAKMHRRKPLAMTKEINKEMAASRRPCGGIIESWHYRGAGRCFKREARRLKLAALIVVQASLFFGGATRDGRRHWRLGPPAGE